jgi:hypothetical protein
METSKEDKKKTTQNRPDSFMSTLRIRNSRDIGLVNPVLTLFPEEFNLPPYFFPLEISQADFAVPPSAFYSPDFPSFCTVG